MKTKLTLLAATLIVGFSSTSATASPPGWDFYGSKVTPAVSAAHAARVHGLKSCCNTSTRYTTGPGKGGVQANRSVACNTGCNAPHNGKNCSTTERKQCAN
ncbi:MAG: hypothetical protein WAW39_24950 [Prosthecobacter sp.]|uniref:hypothetical protein n=1 Tax=Prosthecobacter sp. TaxID=1965333 RepID=UPI003BAFBC26